MARQRLVSSRSPRPPTSSDVARVAGVSQAQVNPAAGPTLESGLKSLLRQDPEVIAIGEIRDRETAEVALQAALTGHLVLTTLHTETAAAAVPRLIDLGIEGFLLKSTLRAVANLRTVAGCSPSLRPIAALDAPWACS